MRPTVCSSDVESVLRSVYAPRKVVAVDSGTSALMIAFRAVTAARPRLPVALPAYCCYDVATAAVGAGVPVALYDVDPGTLGPDFDSLRSVATRGVSAVVAVHLYGVPSEMAELMAIAEETGAVVIEDAAQGAGASYHGRPVGAFGSLAVVSLGRGKGRTAGSGGVVFANDERAVALLGDWETSLMPPRRGLGELVTVAAQYLLGRPALYGLPTKLRFLGLGETVYKPPTTPTGLSRVAARVLATTWPLSAKEEQTRRRNAERLLEILPSNAALRVPVPPAGSESGFLRFPVLASNPLRECLLTPRMRRLGIMPGYPRALPDLQGFGHRNVNRVATFSGARTLASTLVTLPTHSLVSQPDFVAIEEWLRSLGRRSADGSEVCVGSPKGSAAGLTRSPGGGLSRHPGQ